MIANIEHGWPAMGKGRRPSSLPLTRRLYPPMSGHCTSSTARFCQTLTGIASRKTLLVGMVARTLTQAMPPSRRAPMVLNPGHGLCSVGKLTGNQVPRGEEAALRC